MNPFRRRRERRKRLEEERRRARREALAARLERPPADEWSTPGPPAASPPPPPAPPPPERLRDRPRAGSLAAGRTALTRGGRATAGRLGAALPPLSRTGGRVIGPLRSLLALLLRAAALLERTLRRCIAMIASTLRAGTEWLARVLTPERGVFLVILGAAACLVVAQFSDYRGVEIDQPAYADVADIVGAPQVEVRDAGEAHAYLLILVAAAAVALGALALRTGRWQLGRLVGIAGLAAVAVVLLVDMPKGLDEGSVAIRYNGAHAVLKQGFYAELAASAALAFCGLLLSVNLRRARRPARERRRRSRARKAPSLARSGT